MSNPLELKQLQEKADYIQKELDALPQDVVRAAKATRAITCPSMIIRL